MLRARCLIRSARSIPLSSQRFSFAGQLNHAIRFQHTSSESTENNVSAPLTAEELAERKAKYKQIYANKKAKFETSAEGLASIINTKLEEKTSSKQLYHVFFKAVEKLPNLQQFSYKGRYILTDTVIKIIEQSISEINDPSQSELPVTPQEILTKAVYYEVASLPAFNKVAGYLFRNGDVKDVLQLWVSFLEYSVSQRITSPPTTLRMLTLLSYFECTSGTKQDGQVVKQLLKIDELPQPKDLFSYIDRNLPRGSARVKPLKDAINAAYYATKNPNSLELLMKAHTASARGDLFGINNALRDIRKVSELSGIAINEQTLIAFMKMYNPIKFQESINLFNEIVKSGIKPSTSAWNTLLDTVSRRSGTPQMRVQEVETIYNRIETPNEETTVKLIECYTRLGETKKVQALATEENLKSAAISQAYLQSLASQKEFAKVNSFIKKLESRNIVLTHSTYNRLLNAFVKDNKFDEAKAILTEMEAKHVTPDVATFTIILDLILKSARSQGRRVTIETINGFIGQMRTSGVEPTAHTFTAIVDSLGKDADTLKSAQELFEILRSLKLTTYVTEISLISSEFALGAVKDAEKHLADYFASGAKISPANWAMVFEGWSVNGNISKAKEYLALLKSSPTYKPSDLNKFSYYFLLNLADKKKNVEFANEIFDLIVENKATNIITPYTLRTSVSNLNKLGANVPSDLLVKL